MAEKFYITTAITYTSGKPHIGNTYEIILTDAIARMKRMEGYDVYFMTGTDEHGQKIELKAAEKGVQPKQFVDGIAEQIKDIWGLMNISYDKFIRTTDDYHERQVQKIFKKFYDRGDIYKSSYKGMYCTPCESFWTESQLVNGKCPDCGREVKPAEEEAYFFKMGKYADRLVKHIITHPQFIQPVARKNEMMNNFLLADEFIGKSDEEILAAIDGGTLKTKLQDLCVSRTSFKWGIPVDFDPKHVVYVWLDALTNYITGIGYDVDNPAENFKKYWPANVHVIGKDIIRFHTIYWPIFLMALGLPLPQKVFGHPWLLQGGDKMSKSKGNVMYADDLASVYGVDSVRYFVLHEMPFLNDGIITWELMTDRHNSDLANTLGNLVKRTVAMTNQYFGGKVSPSAPLEGVDEELAEVARTSRDRVAAKMDECKVADALDELWQLFRRANKYIDETTPWVLAKDEAQRDRLERVLYNLLEAITIGANLLQPFMPATADKILEQTGGKKRAFADLDKFELTHEYAVANEPATLFERLKQADIEPIVKAISEKQKAQSAPAPAIEHKEPVTIDDFAKIEMRVGTVVACEAVKKSKLLHETVSVGDKTLSILSGIAKHYTAEEMVGKRVIVVTNLPPREMKGILSEGMIVCAEAPDGTLSIVSPEKDVPDGSLLS
ncbi:MAG TPA: methionine--tRNA ligase [Candidatus Coproplasma excrementipullorum]|nr:methionine--tRNA ligase [Candidatus Coproplasma excrementipullorum]